MGPWSRPQDPLKWAVVATVLLSIACSALLLTRGLASERDASPRAGSPYVVVVTGARSADGLVAATMGDAVLSVPASGGLETVIEQVQVLNPSRLVILGGRDLVDDRAAAALAAAANAPVSRLAGPDRYATAAQAALSTYPAPVRQAIIATADASLRTARNAGQAVEGTPVLLVSRDHAPAVTLDALQQLEPEHVTLIGGVSGAVLEQLQQHTQAKVERLRAR